jgi:fucose 4-O-acetylase-like acetyltransferase
MQQTDSAKRNGTIDMIRIIASFAVVLCHVPFPEPYTHGSMAVTRFAVPFFFMVAGWFLFTPGDSKDICEKRIKKSLKATVRMSVICTLLYVVVNTVNCVLRGRDMFYWFTSWMSWETLLNLVAFNYGQLISSMMWYLFAYIYVLLILLVLNNTGFLKKIYFLIPVLLIVNLVMADTLEIRWFHVGNWLLTALPFVLLGIFLREKPDLIGRLSKITLWIMIIAGAGMTVAESLVFHEHVLYVGTLFMSFGLFCLSIKYADRKWPEPLCDFGTYCTPFIFFMHCAVRDVAYSIFGMPEGGLRFVMPLIIFIFTSLISMVIVIVKKNLPSKALAEES